ncbi:hypothetical protein DID96_02585 [Burkholderia sp. Bp8963]|nr:hypothetical protein DID96_02585 [Burkholderia sp. Bp8963]
MTSPGRVTERLLRVNLIFRLRVMGAQNTSRFSKVHTIEHLLKLMLVSFWSRDSKMLWKI